MAGLYFFLSIVSLMFTWAAVVQARRLYALLPLYFLAGWLAGEMALIHLLWQVGLTALLAFTGMFENSLAQVSLGVFALSWLGLAYLHIQSMESPLYLGRALKEGLGENYRGDIPDERQHALADHISSASWLRPFHFSRAGVCVHKHLPYGDAGERNLLDIYCPETAREGGFPVLLQVHGGAWIIGSKEQQGKPLMYHMAERGWLCVAINYRLSPQVAFPNHIVDVKKSIAWIREHIAEYGGNPDYISITGGSRSSELPGCAYAKPRRMAAGL